MRSFSIKIPVVIIIGIFLVDQATKVAIQDHFMAHPGPEKILPVLDLVLVWNRGISWGWFNNTGPYNALIFSALAGVISVALGIALWRTQSKLVAWALSLIIGGALGNLADRIRFGGVLDFIYFHWHSYAFPAFNIADTAITFGVCLIILEEVLRFKAERRAK